ncbi:MAG: hypothetical protein AAF567_03895, partial [Actinomycetota bacterium]
IPVGIDGTMDAYCDIARSHADTDVIALEVLRLGTGEILTGSLNGAPLGASFSFAPEVEEATGQDMGDAPVYTDFVVVADDGSEVFVEVPVQWADTDGSPAEFGPSIFAAPNLDGFLETWDVPGIIVELNRDLGPADHGSVLDAWSGLQCDSQGRQPFEDAAYIGEFEIWINCGGTTTEVLTLAASLKSGTPGVVRMLIQVVSPIDISAADQALRTFDFNIGT